MPIIAGHTNISLGPRLCDKPDELKRDRIRITEAGWMTVAIHKKFYKDGKTMPTMTLCRICQLHAVSRIYPAN